MYGSLVCVDLPDEKIAFDDAGKAEEFALLSVRNDAGCFSSYESVSAMAFLAEILKKMAMAGKIRPEELYVLRDSEVIDRIRNSGDAEIVGMWNFFENLESYKILRYPRETGLYTVSSRCKRRFIDPLVALAGKGHPIRVSEFSDEFRETRDYHLARREEWIVLGYPA